MGARLRRPPPTTLHNRCQKHDKIATTPFVRYAVPVLCWVFARVRSLGPDTPTNAAHETHISILGGGVSLGVCVHAWRCQV